MTHTVSRRDFIRWAVAVPAAAATLEEFLPRLASAMEETIKEYPIIWLQASTCSGCSVSVINTIHPSIKNVILEQVLPGHKLTLAYHGTLMAATGSMSTDAAREAAKKYQGKYVLVVEGAIPTKSNGVYGSIGEETGKPVTMLHWVDLLGRRQDGHHRAKRAEEGESSKNFLTQISIKVKMPIIIRFNIQTLF